GEARAVRAFLERERPSHDGGQLTEVQESPRPGDLPAIEARAEPAHAMERQVAVVKVPDDGQAGVEIRSRCLVEVGGDDVLRPAEAVTVEKRLVVARDEPEYETTGGLVGPRGAVCGRADDRGGT